jgi:thioredoxin reductase
MSKVAIIGAGVSGLSMANYLEKNNIDYHLYERRTPNDLKGHGFILPKKNRTPFSIIILTIFIKKEVFLKNIFITAKTEKSFQKKTLMMYL